MSKTIIIALLIVSLVGGGAVFAEYDPSAVFLGLNNGTEENGQEEEKELAEDKNEERPETADAFHEALRDGEASPEDERPFGEIVSERARNEEVNLGMEVSQAARESKEENDENNGNGINTGNSLFDNNDNSGNIGNGGSPGNSGNAGGGRPGN